MHHCRISGIQIVSKDINLLAQRRPTLRLQVLQLAIQEGQVWFSEVDLWEVCITGAATDVARLDLVDTIVFQIING